MYSAAKAVYATICSLRDLSWSLAVSLRDPGVGTLLCLRRCRLFLSLSYDEGAWEQREFEEAVGDLL